MYPVETTIYLRKLLAAAILLTGAAMAQGEEKPSTTAARRAIERGLPFLERDGVAWMNQKGCVSCHHVPFLLWSHNEARARGVDVDVKKLAKWTDWSWQFSRTKRAWYRFTSESLSDSSDNTVPAETLTKLKPVVNKPFATESDLLAELGKALTGQELDEHKATLVNRATRPREPENDGGGLDTLTQLLLGRAHDADDEKSDAFAADMRDLIERWQQSDGSWRAAGQLPAQNRPRAETNAVTTMWTIVALATLEQPEAPPDNAIKQAMNFLTRVKPEAISNESLIGALLVERRFGRGDRAGRLLKELLNRQNPDGGWAWRQGGDSDAFATGQALYALSESGLSLDAAAIQRGRDLLIQSQTPDGSWSVPSRAISSATSDARLTKLAPIYRYWGTAWATIGLSRTLPDAKAKPPG